MVPKITTQLQFNKQTGMCHLYLASYNGVAQSYQYKLQPTTVLLLDAHASGPHGHIRLLHVEGPIFLDQTLFA